MYNFNKENVDANILDKISISLKHRGPNSKGYFVKDYLGLGSLRLSIIDLSEKGNQPMFSRDKKFCIVYNGETYNYLELKKELAAKYNFISDTDTEVVLYSYIEWGEDCLRKLNGMFAFAIFDAQENKLFIARDRFGIKPLYYYLKNDSFIFSSELKSFKYILPNITINDRAVYNYLVFNRTDYGEETFFKDIKILPHGQQITIKNNKFSIKQWYALKSNLKTAYTCAEELRHDLIDSVNLTLRSDVPLGVCFSGGLDSSTIVSILTNELKIDNVKTFSAVYGKGKHGDESKYIDEFAGVLKRNMYKTCISSDDILKDIDDFVYYIDEPTPQLAPFIHYEVMKLAQDKAVVLLDGQGADEEFAGYHYFFGAFFKELLYKGKWPALAKEIFWYLLRHKSIFGVKSFLYFLLPGSTETRIRLAQNSSLSLSFLSQFTNERTIPEKLYQAQDLQTSLIEHFEYKLEHLLKWEDRNSMRFSLESRVPFLNHRIVEKALSLSGEFKIKNGETKWILRKALNGILPDKIKNRQDKIGFDNPCAEWFREEKFKRFILDILNSGEFNKLPYFSHKKCLKIYNEHLRNKADRSRQIWKWINLTLWHRKFFQN